MDKNYYLNNLKEKLSVYYDLTENLNSEIGNIDIYAKFSERTDRYVLTKNNVLYSQEAFEHTFCKVFDTISLDEIKKFSKFLESSIDNYVNPDDAHMSSIIRGVLITDKQPDKDVITFVKKYKFYKSFKLGLRGWVNIGLNLVDISNENNFYCNKVGKNGRDYFKI